MIAHARATPSYMRMRSAPVAASRCRAYALSTATSRGNVMGKYFIGWILGVPAVVLVGIYVVSHLL